MRFFNTADDRQTLLEGDVLDVSGHIEIEEDNASQLGIAMSEEDDKDGSDPNKEEQEFLEEEESYYYYYYYYGAARRWPFRGGRYIILEIFR